MAEWSKAVDLRPTIIRCEGSNPSSCMSSLPTAERCLPSALFIKIYIFSFDIYFSNTYVSLPTARGERCSMYSIIIVLRYILDTLYSSIMIQQRDFN